ncbi:MAG TPA: hypothetical protein VEW71_10245 [Allosphingosinicella sp.]|nr:hypothetical protein [Allosphingosinicella sp.]
MKRLATCAALALALAGCGDTSAPSSEDAQIRIENPGSDRLKTLSPLNQRIGLMRAIRDSGKRCRNVEALAYQQEYQGMAMWVALCADGRHWAVYIAPNEDVQVRNCSEAAQLDLPHCRPVAPRPPSPDAPAGSAVPGNVVEDGNRN